MAGGYWTFFDRPVRYDPLWWAGIISGTTAGLVGGVVNAVRHGFDPAEFVMTVAGSALFVTYWVVGLIGGCAREFVRGMREASDPPADSTT